MPVGPVGLLCIRRTLARGRASGLASGLGAATADTLYGCVAGFGLTFVSGLMVGHHTWLRLVGGLFLCCLGIRTFVAGPTGQSDPVDKKGLIGAYVSTFLLTISNPLTILFFTAAFVALGLAGMDNEFGQAWLLVLGVFVGSSLWWLLLSGGVSLIRGKLSSEGLQWVNRISGVAIVLFGVCAALSTLLWKQ